MAVANWRTGLTHVAVIEFEEECRGLDAALLDIDPRVQAESMGESPRGVVWYALSAEGLELRDRESAVSAAMQRLKHAVLRGKLPSFRIVADRVRRGFEARPTGGSAHNGA